MTTARQSLGRWGEALAADCLTRRGYAIVARNARTPYGEIDLVARQADPPVIVFVEVKTRATRTFGPPEVSVTPRQQAHLLAAAQSFLQSHPELEGDWRIDVIAVERLPHQPPQITHFENAIH